MSKDKKFKINLIEKSRQNLGSSSKSIKYSHKQKSQPQKSDKNKPIVFVHKKEEKIAETKQFKAAEQPSDLGDVFEIKFSEGKPNEAVKKIIPEKIIMEESRPMSRKDKIAVFQEIEIIDEIKMYKSITIFEMWAFTIILGVVTISGLFLMRDWLFSNFGVYGNIFIPTPEGTQNIHIWSGLVFAILGLIHVSIHIFSKKKYILPKQTLQDFKAFIHSGMYLIGLARNEDYGTSGRFCGRQRITYIALVYILGLTTITGLLYYINFLSRDLTIVHVIPAGLSVMVLFFHFLITIKKHDMIALNCTFFTGKLPLWYVKKNNPVWYKQIMSKRKINLERLSNPLVAQINKNLIERDLTDAVLKFILLTNSSPNLEDVKAFVYKLQVNLQPDKLKRIIELAKELKDETEEENKQKIEEGPQQNEKVQTEVEKSPG
jgi:hypothetical protein